MTVSSFAKIGCKVLAVCLGSAVLLICLYLVLLLFLFLICLFYLTKQKKEEGIRTCVLML
jgi:hypothetical protein